MSKRWIASGHELYYISASLATSTGTPAVLLRPLRGFQFFFAQSAAALHGSKPPANRPPTRRSHVLTSMDHQRGKTWGAWPDGVPSACDGAVPTRARLAGGLMRLPGSCKYSYPGGIPANTHVVASRTSPQPHREENYCVGCLAMVQNPKSTSCSRCKNVVGDLVPASIRSLRTEIRVRVFRAVSKKKLSAVCAEYHLSGVSEHLTVQLLRGVRGVELTRWSETRHRTGGTSLSAKWAVSEVEDIAHFLQLHTLVSPSDKNRKAKSNFAVNRYGDVRFLLPPFTLSLNVTCM